MTGLRIRDAGPADHDALLAQFQALNIHEAAISQDRRTDHDGAVECLAAAWRRVRETKGAALVAELHGAVVGHLFLTLERAGVLVPEELRAYAYVAELYVRDAARNAGVGAALMRQAELRAGALGYRQMRIGVLAGNDGAERMYRRLGFAPYALELKKSIAPA